MNREFENLDLETLKLMHKRELDRLNAQLLDGAEWNEVSDQRKIVTDLCVSLHRKIASANLNPAEHSPGEIEGRN